MKLYYQKFNLPEQKIEIKIDINYDFNPHRDFGIRRRTETQRFDSISKRFTERKDIDSSMPVGTLSFLYYKGKQ